MELAYYPGCSLHSSSALYDLQTRLVLKKLGINLNEIADWNCCGATSAGKIDDFLAVIMPARNLGIAGASGFPEMVIPCSACYSKTLMAQKSLENDPGLKNKINAEFSKKITGSIKISSILEILLANLNELTGEANKKLIGLKPVCYYGCMLTRFPYDLPVSDNVENPQGMETILKTLDANPIDWSYKTDCCGASASVNDEEMAFSLMSKIMQDALARGANCFVVTCPMCQLNMDAYQDKFCEKHGIDNRLPVFFITECVGLALGMGIEDLQIDRHFIDGEGLLKELNIV